MGEQTVTFKEEELVSKLLESKHTSSNAAARFFGRLFDQDTRL